MFHRYRIKSAPRFITFITICTLLLIFTMMSVTGINNADGLSDKSSEPQFLQVEVYYGDTLWDIASQYGPKDVDIRETVHAICTVNDVDAGSLQEGEILLIPTVV